MHIKTWTCERALAQLSSAFKTHASGSSCSTRSTTRRTRRRRSNKKEGKKLKLKQNSIDKVIIRGDSGWDRWRCQRHFLTKNSSNSSHIADTTQEWKNMKCAHERRSHSHTFDKEKEQRTEKTNGKRKNLIEFICLMTLNRILFA